MLLDCLQKKNSKVSQDLSLFGYFFLYLLSDLIIRADFRGVTHTPVVPTLLLPATFKSHSASRPCNHRSAEGLQIVGRLPSEGDTAVLQSHFVGVQLCLFRLSYTVHHLLCFLTDNNARGAWPSERPFQRADRHHYVPPSVPLSGLFWRWRGPWTLIRTASGEERGRDTETSRVCHEGPHNNNINNNIMEICTVPHLLKI